MDGIEHRMAEKTVLDPGGLVLINGVHADAVGFQHIERVLDFLQAAVDIGQRQSGK
jgi:hypothetical protein